MYIAVSRCKWPYYHDHPGRLSWVCSYLRSLLDSNLPAMVFDIRINLATFYCCHFGVMVPPIYVLLISGTTLINEWGGI